MGAATRLFDLDTPQNRHLRAVPETKGKNEHTSG